MKKRLLVMAMAGVALAGCVSDEVAEVAQKNEPVKIAFDSPVLYDNAESRALVSGEIGANLLTKTYDERETFKIFAVQYPENSIFSTWEGLTTADVNGKEAKYAGSSIDGWAPFQMEDNPETSDKDETEYYYWPSEYKMAFAAISPYWLGAGKTNLPDCAVTYSKDGLKITNFQVQSDAANQYDLLYGERITEMTANKMQLGAGDYNGVPIKFHHALASIRFSLMNHTNADLVLKSITLWGAKYKGDFSENYDETKNSAIYKDKVNPSWDVDPDSVLMDNSYLAFSGQLEFPYNPNYISELVKGTTGNTVHQLLLIPQTIGSTDKEIYLKVVYTVDGNEKVKYVQLNNRLSLESKKDEGDEELINEWKMGYRYTYRITYDAGSAQKDMIYFAPSTEAFTDEKVVVVSL